MGTILEAEIVLPDVMARRWPATLRAGDPPFGSGRINAGGRPRSLDCASALRSGRPEGPHVASVHRFTSTAAHRRTLERGLSAAELAGGSAGRAPARRCHP